MHNRDELLSAISRSINNTAPIVYETVQQVVVDRVEELISDGVIEAIVADEIISSEVLNG